MVLGKWVLAPIATRNSRFSELWVRHMDYGLINGTFDIVYLVNFRHIEFGSPSGQFFECNKIHMLYVL